jgi:hypothetical protein
MEEQAGMANATATIAATEWMCLIITTSKKSTNKSNEEISLRIR